MPLLPRRSTRNPTWPKRRARKSSKNAQEHDAKICACSSSRRASTRQSPTRCWPAPAKCWTKPAPNYDRITVPGALEVPAAIAMALEAAQGKRAPYDGVVALGCVIQGETYHFEIVSNESARGLMSICHRRTAAARQRHPDRRHRGAGARARRRRARQQGRRRRARRARHGRAQAQPPATLMAARRAERQGAQGQQARRRAARRGAGALPDGSRRHRPERDPGRVRKPLDRPRGRGRAISAGRGRLLPRHRLRRGARAARARSADRRGAGESLAAQAHRGGAARRVARRRLRARAPQATCRRASWWPNMPTSPPPSSSATRPAWSMPCSISWRGNCGRRIRGRGGALLSSPGSPRRSRSNAGGAPERIRDGAV